MRSRPGRPAAAAVAALLVISAAFSAGAAPSSLSLSASPRSVFLGEPFSLSLSYQGEGTAGSPRFDASAPAAISGPSVQQSRSMSMVNGHVTSRSSVDFRYSIAPDTPGVFTVSNATVTVDGKTLACRDSVSVTVIGPSPSPFLDVSLSASKSRVLIDEPFEVRVDVTVRRLPPPYRDESPFSTRPAPKLLVPHLSSEQPPDAEPQDLSALLQSLLAPRGQPGFTINDIEANGFMPFSQGPTLFAPPRTETTLGGEPAWRYRIATRYTVPREGAVNFRPCIFRGSVITGVRNGREGIVDQLFCASQPLTVEVVQPPAAGRPASYCGSVGTSLSAAASLDAQSCRQGDPVRLTLDLTGRFSRRSFRTPVLSDRPGFRDVFRIYESGDDVRTESLPDGLRLQWTLRPLQAGTLEIPPIDIAYYDTDSGAYVTVRSAPVPLRVDEVPAFDPDQLFGSPDADPSEAPEGDDARLPAAITVSPDALSPTPPPPVAVLVAVLAAPPLLALFALVLRRCLRTRDARRRASRRRRAPLRLRRALRRARTPEAALDAVRAFFRDVHDIPPAAFTPADADAALRADGHPEAELARVRAILQPLYDAAFDGSGNNAAFSKETANELGDILASFSGGSHATSTTSGEDVHV